jgi:hypothetical protein
VVQTSRKEEHEEDWNREHQHPTQANEPFGCWLLMKTPPHADDTMSRDPGETGNSSENRDHAYTLERHLSSPFIALLPGGFEPAIPSRHLRGRQLTRISVSFAASSSADATCTTRVMGPDELRQDIVTLRDALLTGSRL